MQPLRGILTSFFVALWFLALSSAGALAQSNGQSSLLAFCPAADAGPADSGSAGSGGGASKPPRIDSGGGDDPNSVVAHVAELRDRLSAATKEYAEATERLLTASPGKAILPEGMLAEHVTRLQRDLRALVREQLKQAASAPDVELAIRAAEIDTLLERINAYESVYGKAPGSATTRFNVLSEGEPEKIRTSLLRAQESLAISIARHPSGAAPLGLKARYDEVQNLLAHIENEISLRTVAGEPILRRIVTKDTRARALEKHSIIAAVDADSSLGDRYTRKLAMHFEMRLSSHPRDAALTLLRDKALASVKKGDIDLGREVLTSAWGKKPPPDTPDPIPTPDKPTPGSGSDGIRTALIGEAEAIKTRSPKQIAAAQGRLAAELSVVKASLSPEVLFPGFEFASLDAQQLDQMAASYTEWLGYLKAEAATPGSPIQVQMEIKAAEIRLQQIKAMQLIRSGSAWHGVLGKGAPARGPPPDVGELDILLRARMNTPSAVAARATQAAAKGQTEAALLATPFFKSDTTVNDIATARANQLRAQQQVLEETIQQVLSRERALIGAPGVADLDGRRLLAGARQAVANAARAHNADVASLRAAHPALTTDLIIVSPPKAWGGSPTHTKPVLDLVRDAVATVEGTRIHAEGRMLTPVVIAAESNGGFPNSKRVTQARFGVTPASENIDFEKLFPSSQAWTRNRIELTSNVSRMPGGVIVDPVLPDRAGEQIEGIWLDPETDIIHIVSAGRLLRTNLKVSDAEFRDAVAFALDGRLIAVDIRGLKLVDLQWLLKNALEFPVNLLPPGKLNDLLQELASLSSVNLHPDLEHGPWSMPLIQSDQMIFNILPHRDTVAIGELSFEGLDLKSLRALYTSEKADLSKSLTVPVAERTPLKSVLTFTASSIACEGGHLEISVALAYDVYFGDTRMTETSSWLSRRDTALRQRAPVIAAAARFASLEAMLRPLAGSGRLGDIGEAIFSPADPTFSPKFLCSPARFTGECELEALASATVKARAEGTLKEK